KRSVAIAEQDAYVAAAGVCHGDIGLTVAVEIPDGSGRRRRPHGIARRGSEIDTGQMRRIPHHEQRKGYRHAEYSQIRSHRDVPDSVPICIVILLNSARASFSLISVIRAQRGICLSLGTACTVVECPFSPHTSTRPEEFAPKNP